MSTYIADISDGIVDVQSAAGYHAVVMAPCCLGSRTPWLCADSCCRITCLADLQTQLNHLLFMVHLILPCFVEQAVMEQVCHLPTPISSPVQTVMGSPAGPFQSLSSHGPFSVAANSSGASYQQSLQSDPQGMGGGIAMGRASGIILGHLHADRFLSSLLTTLLACVLAHSLFHSLVPATTHLLAHSLFYLLILSCTPHSLMHLLAFSNTCPKCHRVTGWRAQSLACSLDVH